MRTFLWVLAIFATAIGVAVTAHMNPGNMVLFYPPYRIDMSLNFFLIFQVLLFLFLYGLVRAVRTTQKMPGRVSLYRQARRERESNKALREALKALFEGRFGHAEKAALRATELPENAGLAALIGARAAQHMGQRQRRDAWLVRTLPDNSLKVARLMTSIELLVEDHQPQAALDSVEELTVTGTRHIHALQWALKANQQAKNWPEVLRLVRTLDKRNALHPAVSQRLRELAYEDLLSDRSHDIESIRVVWAGIPAEDRQRAFVALHAASAFNARGLHDEARNLVEKALIVDWDERLVRAYRESATAEGSPELLAQIENCEEWLKQKPTDAELALTLGSLCLKQKLWGKAQRYLEQALSDAPDSRMVRECHLKLAQLQEELAQPEQAAIHYRQCAIASMLEK